MNEENTRDTLTVEDTTEKTNPPKKNKIFNTSDIFWIVVGILVCAIMAFIISDNVHNEPKVPYLTEDIMYQAMLDGDYNITEHEALALLDWMKLALDYKDGYSINVDVRGGTGIMFDRWEISLTNPIETIKMTFFYGSMTQKWRLIDLEWGMRRYYGIAMEEKSA